MNSCYMWMLKAVDFSVRHQVTDFWQVSDSTHRSYKH